VAPPVRVIRTVVFDERDGPLPALLLALTVLAGLLDAFSILRLGGVFVATMTGNLVFIGLAAAGATGFVVGIPALALGGFVVGVLIGGRAYRAAPSHRGAALRNVLVVKLSLAGAVMVIAVLAGPQFPPGARDAMVVLLAMSMGAQLAAIRQLKVPDLLTVVLTMTITGALTERSSGWTDPKLLRRALALIAFALGAVIGALLILHVGVAAELSFGSGSSLQSLSPRTGCRARPRAGPPHDQLDGRLRDSRVRRFKEPVSARVHPGSPAIPVPGHRGARRTRCGC
jgi:uncharacterized membrane protein YoaK (UPF0700 family)